MIACKIDETMIRIGPVDLGLTMFGVIPGGGAMAGSSSSDTEIEIIFQDSTNVTTKNGGKLPRL